MANTDICPCAFRDSLDVLAAPRAANVSVEDHAGIILRNKQHLAAIVGHTHLSAAEKAEIEVAIR